MSYRAYNFMKFHNKLNETLQIFYSFNNKKTFVIKAYSFVNVSTASGQLVIEKSIWPLHLANADVLLA